MLGPFRFLLAIAVAFSHLSLGGQILHVYAAASVTCFYMISGYLMSAVMNERYHYTMRGRKAFYLNRILRIYPTYWLVFIFSSIVCLLLPSWTSSSNSRMIFPDSIYSFLCNATLFDSIYQSHAPIPVSWSLGVEVFFYILIGAFLSKNMKIVSVWFLASVAYTIFMLVNQYDFGDRYYPLQAASLFFSAGAFIYHSGVASKRHSKPEYPIMLGLLWLSSPLIILALKLNITTYGFYFMSVMGALMLIQALRTKIDSKQANSIMQKMGDLSYPIFLTHQLSGVLLSIITYGQFNNSHTAFPITAIALSIAISFAINSTIEKRVTLIRNKIKQHLSA